MAQIGWDSDIQIQTSLGGTTYYLTYSSRSPFNEYAFAFLSTEAERVWFYQTDNVQSSSGVSNGDGLYVGSYAGLADKHWLGRPDSSLDNLLPWQKWIDYSSDFYWIIEATDGSSTIDKGTSFTLRAGDGSGYLVQSTSDADFLNVGAQASALVFTASPM